MALNVATIELRRESLEAPIWAHFTFQDLLMI